MECRVNIPRQSRIGAKIVFDCGNRFVIPAWHGARITSQSQRLACLTAGQSFAPLLFCELMLARQAHATQFGAFAALGGLSSDQVSLDIIQADRPRNHETFRGCRSVGRGFS